MQVLCQIRFTACLVMSACLWLPGLGTDAGEKKKDEKKAVEPIIINNDELTDKDEKDTHPNLKRSPRKFYTIKLTEGKVYQIDLKSKGFDAVLRLEDSTGKEVAFNDDYTPGSLDSRILFKATASAEYKIIATCLDRKIGKFSLSVTEPVGITNVSLYKGKTIEFGSRDGKVRYVGGLTEQDGIVFDHYYKVLAVTMEAGKAYRIDLQSSDFDAFLFLEDALGNKLAQDDDSGGGTNARIIHTPSKTGVFRVIATTLPARKTGRFVLEINPEKSAK